MDVPHAKGDSPSRRNDDLVACVRLFAVCFIDVGVSQDPVNESRRVFGFASMGNATSKVRGQPDGDVCVGRDGFEDEFGVRVVPALDRVSHAMATGAVGKTHHFEFHRPALIRDKHAHAMVEGLVSCTIVRKNEREIDWNGASVEMKVPIRVLLIFNSLRAPCRGFSELEHIVSLGLYAAGNDVL